MPGGATCVEINGLGSSKQLLLNGKGSPSQSFLYLPVPSCTFLYHPVPCCTFLYLSESDGFMYR